MTGKPPSTSQRSSDQSTPAFRAPLLKFVAQLDELGCLS